MPLPDVPELAEFFSGVRLSPHKPSDSAGAIEVPFLPAEDEKRRIGRESPLWLHYPQNTKVSLTAAFDRINRELGAAGHSRHEEFVLFILALASLMGSQSSEMIYCVNRIFTSVCSADVGLYYVLFGGFPDNYSFELPPFKLGPLRLDKLRYRCEKVNSDYFSRYRDFLVQAWAAEREPQSIRVLDIPSVRELIFQPALRRARDDWELEAWASIVDGYFSLQNRILFHSFFLELIGAQSAFLSAGGPYFDPRPLSNIIKSTRIAVFQNIGRDNEGFVAPAGIGTMFLDLANVHERIPALRRELKSEYGFERFDETPLHRSIKLFADFVARGRRHEIDGNPSEALLHFVIALELLFGDRQAIQKKIAERVAIITFRENGRSFQEQYASIEEIYGLRSKYVHAGQEIRDDARLEQLRLLCEQVFRCLLRLQAFHSARAARGESVLTDWCRELDYLVAGISAGKPPSPEQVREAFIA